MPTTITRFGGQIIDPDRGWQIITALLRSYMSERLGIPGSEGIESTAARFPEVERRVLRW